MNKAEPLKHAKAMVKLLATQLQVGRVGNYAFTGFYAITPMVNQEVIFWQYQNVLLQRDGLMLLDQVAVRIHE